MKSFALWYKIQGSDKDKKHHKGKKHHKCKDENRFDLHMNFWSESLMDRKAKIQGFAFLKKTKRNKITPFLDVGIKVYEFRTIESFIFQCPFKVNKDEILDLEKIIINENNAQIIFNTDVETETKKGYKVLNLNGEEKILVYPLPKKENYVVNVEYDRTNIEFNLKKLHAYIEKHEKDFAEINSLYIRFRIQSNSLRDKVYSDREGIDKSFQSRFSGTRILDFKINEERNLNPEDNKEYLINGYEVATFRKVHLLMMESASCDVQSFSSGEMSCREVENDLWNDYCGEVISDGNKQILAYHWKFDDKLLENKRLSSVSCLAKVAYSKTGVKPIIAYSIIVVALSMISNIALYLIIEIMKPKASRNFPPYLWGLLLAVSLMILGIYLNKVKKK